MLEEERADVRPNDRSPSRKRADEARKAQRESESGASTLSPMLAARVSGLLLPSAVTLLEALVASSRLEKAMEPQQGAVCQCMGQAVAQVNLVLMRILVERYLSAVYAVGCCWRERGVLEAQWGAQQLGVLALGAPLPRCRLM